MRAFRIEPSANAHLDQIYDYSAVRWSEDQADDYIAGLFAEFAVIADRKTPWRSLDPSFGVTGYSRRWRSHVIYWKGIAGGDVAIVAILHQRMHQSPRLREALDGPP